MKLIPGVVISKVEENSYVAVTTGKSMKKFNGMVRLNESAVFLVRLLESDKSEKQLVTALTDKYDVTAEEALANVRAVTEKLRAEGLIR